MDSIKVSTIGNTGDGKQITVVTDGNDPNYVVSIFTPVAALVIRYIHIWLTVFSALLAAGMTTDLLPARDFLTLCETCAKLSISGATVDLIKNLITIFGKLEGKYPIVTGSV